jgi:hypothetical protein
MVDTNYGKLAAARMLGLRTEVGNVLSEHVLESVDLTGIGRLVAATANDEVNTLAALEFQHVFGRAAVYQLASHPLGGSGLAPSAHLRARTLFGPEITFNVLAQRFAVGAHIKKTPLTDEFDFNRFQAMYSGNAIVLGVIGADGELVLRTDNETSEPKPGETVLAVVEPPSGV